MPLSVEAYIRVQRHYLHLFFSSVSWPMTSIFSRTQIASQIVYSSQGYHIFGAVTSIICPMLRYQEPLMHAPSMAERTYSPHASYLRFHRNWYFWCSSYDTYVLWWVRERYSRIPLSYLALMQIIPVEINFWTDSGRHAMLAYSGMTDQQPGELKTVSSLIEYMFLPLSIYAVTLINALVPWK